MTTRVFLVSLLLIPAAAVAQPVPVPPDPNEPTNPADQAPPAPATEPVVEPTPPTVIVNPPPPQPAVVEVEPSYEVVEDSWNAPMFTTGALVFVGSYGASVIAAASVNDADRDRWADRLYVPVVGPWLALDDHGSCPIALQQCDDSTTTKVLLVADGVFQAAGVVTMVAGILRPAYHRRVVRTSTAEKVRIRPTVGRGGSGLTIFGRF